MIGRLVVGVLGGGAVVGLVWLGLTIAERDSRWPKVALTVAAERERARASGLEIVPEMLRRTPPVPPAQNAGPLYRAAVASIPLSLRDVWREPSPEAREAAWRDLEPTLALLRRAVAKPHCDFGWDWRIADPEAWNRRRTLLLDLSMLTGELITMAGKRPEQARALLTLAGQIVNHMAQDEGMVVHFFRTQQLTRAFLTVEHLARRYPERIPELASLSESWDAEKGMLTRAYRAQVLRERLDRDQGRKKTYKPETEPLLDYNPLWRELDKIDFALGWKQYTDGREAVELRYWRLVKAALERVPEGDLHGQWVVLRDLDLAETERAKAIPGYWIPTRYSFYAGQQVVLQSRRRQHRILLAAIGFRARTGHWPTALSELGAVGALPDPFGKGPFRFDGKQLWSVGGNGNDEKGQGDDLPLALEEPKPMEPGTTPRRPRFPRPPRRLRNST